MASTVAAGIPGLVGLTLSSITAAVTGGVSLLGGRGSCVGALLGALLIQVALSVTTFLGLDAAYQSFLLGGLTLAAVVAVRPAGAKCQWRYTHGPRRHSA